MRGNVGILKSNRGAVFVFVALFLVLMVIFIALAISVGSITYIRNQAQARVDSAALAGVTAISDGQTTVEERANLFSDQNTVVNSSTDPDNNITPMIYNPNIDPPLNPAGSWGTANAILVSTTAPAPIFFGKLLNGGNSNVPINVSAVAAVPNKANLPIALLGCVPGAKEFKYDQTPDRDDDSAFTSFTLSSANANTLREMVNDPNTIPPVEPNKSCISLINGQVTDVLQEMIDKYSPYSPPPCFIVPAFENRDVKPNQCKIFQSFAKICITDIVIRDKDNPGRKFIKANVESCDADIWSAPVIAAGRPKLVK